MSEISWKETVRKTLSALPKQIKSTQIGAETGVLSGRIRTFLSSGHLNTNDVKKLYDWLVNNHYITIAGGPGLPQAVAEEHAPYAPDNPFSEIAAMLHNLANVLENEAFTEETRITLARNNIEPLLIALQEYENMLAQRENLAKENAG